MPARWPVPDPLGYFAGSWLVERVMRDLTTGQEGGFTGRTDFGPLDDPAAPRALLSHESGTAVWGGVARPAERTLRFLPGTEPGTVRVEFADGRFFHGLDLRDGVWRGEHPCAADIYEGEFRVGGPHRWHTRWRVTGPAKDLLLVTRCTRPDTGSSAADTRRS